MAKERIKVQLRYPIAFECLDLQIIKSLCTLTPVRKINDMQLE